MKKLPSQEHIKSILHYDEETGLFRWRKNPKRSPQWNGRYVGTVAGRVRKDGRRVISIEKTFYRAHRLAWKYVYGTDPIGEIDHKDYNPRNDAIENLRQATTGQNIHNRPGRSLRGLPKGITITASGKFGAQITLEGVGTWLGSHDTLGEATEAYRKAASSMYGDFARIE